jgi:hypothetical protein
MRSGRPDRRLTSAAIAVVVIAALYVAMPAVAGLDETWLLLRSGNAWWLGLAVVLLELGSYAGYVLLFQRVFGGVDGIGFRRSCEITLAGVAAPGCSPPRALAAVGRAALRLLRARDAALLGAVAWWGVRRCGAGCVLPRVRRVAAGRRGRARLLRWHARVSRDRVLASDGPRRARVHAVAARSRARGRAASSPRC